MRWIGLAIVLLSIPFFTAYFRVNQKNRGIGVMWAVVFIFCTGPLQVSASLVAWPEWQGISKGMILSLTDSIIISLLLSSKSRKIEFPYAGLFIPYILAVIISLTGAAVPMASSFVVFQLFQMLLLYIVLSKELQRPNALQGLYKGLSIGLLIQACFVVAQKFGGTVQASGTMGHQNILGMMVELTAIPLIIAVMEGERNKLIHAGIVAGALVLAGGGSRGAIGFFTLGLVVAFLMSFWRKSTMRKTRVIGLAGLAAAISLPVGAATLEDRFGDTPITAQEEQRDAFERAAVAMAKDHILGVGSNNFVPANNLGGYATRAGLDTSQFNRSKPVHNAWLLARAESGWGGQIALIFMFGGLVSLGIITASRCRSFPQVGLVVGPASAILAISFHNNFEYAWHMIDTQRLFFVCAALIASSAMVADRTLRKNAT